MILGQASTHLFMFCVVYALPFASLGYEIRSLYLERISLVLETNLLFLRRSELNCGFNIHREYLYSVLPPTNHSSITTTNTLPGVKLLVGVWHCPLTCASQVT